MSVLLTNHQSRESEGYFRIGNVALQIPPEDLNLNRVAAKDEVLPLRSKYSLQVATGHARWDLSIRWKALLTSSGGQTNWKQWEDVQTILAMLKAAPFVEVENADVRAQLADQDSSMHSARLGFALRQLIIQSSGDIPDCLDCSLSMTLFNYQPYSTNFAYKIAGNQGGDASNSETFRLYLEAWKSDNLTAPFDGGAQDGDVPPPWKSQKASPLKLGWRKYTVQNGAPGSSSAPNPLPVDHFTSQGDNDGVTFRYQKRDIHLTQDDTQDCYVQQVALMFTNNLATIPLAGYQYPTMQHIGATSTMVSVSLMQKGYAEADPSKPSTPNCFAKISNMLSTLESQYTSMRTQWRSTSTIYRLQAVTVENQILNMFGVFGLMPSEFNLQTVNEAGDLMQGQLVAKQYENLTDNLDPYQVTGPLSQYSGALAKVFSQASVMAAMNDPKQAASVNALSQFLKAQAANDQTWLINYLSSNIGILPLITGMTTLPTPVLPSELATLAQAVPSYTSQLPYLTYLIASTSYSDFFYLSRSAGVSMSASGSATSSAGSAMPSAATTAAALQAMKTRVEANTTATTAAIAAVYSSIFQARLSSNAAGQPFDPTFSSNVNIASKNPAIQSALVAYAQTPGANPANKTHGAYFDLGLRGSAGTFSPASYFADDSINIQQQATKSLVSLLPSMFSPQQAFNVGTTGSTTTTSEIGTTTSDAYGILLRTALPTFSMRAAFPTFKLFLMEEDNLHFYYMFDNFYSYASVLEIETEDHRERGQTARIRITNLAGVFSHKLFDNTTLGKEEQSFYPWLPKSPNGATAMAGMRDMVVTTKTLDGQNLQEGTDVNGRPTWVPLKYYALQPGSKIQIRMGYDDNPDNLIPVFQGRITEIQGTEILEITAQGFKQELDETPSDTLCSDGYSPLGIAGNIFQSGTNLITSLLPPTLDVSDAWTAVKSFFQKAPAYGGVRIFGDGGKTGTIMSSIIKASNAKHFGHWQINQNPDEYLKGFTWASTVGSWTLGASATVGAALMSAYDRSDENILINHFVGADATYAASTTKRPLTFENTSIVTPAAYHLPDAKDGAGEFLTPWSVIRDVSRRYPEYVLAVKNYGFPFMSDATLVFGHPLDWYYTRMPYFGEPPTPSLTMADQSNFQSWWAAGGRANFINAYNGYWRTVTVGVDGLDMIKYWAHKLNKNWTASTGEDKARAMDNNPVAAEQEIAGMIYETGNGFDAAFARTTGLYQATVKEYNTTFLQMQTDMRKMVGVMRNAGGDIQVHASDRVKPIRRYHFVDHRNIIHNGIELNEKINNAVALRGIVTKANIMIPDQHTRVLDVNSQVIYPESNIPKDDDELAMAYAQSFLKTEVGKMYGGELMLTMDPTIESNDIVMITDPSTGIVGPIEVDSVMHIFNQEMGAVTIVRPRAWVMINEASEAGILAALFRSLSTALYSGTDAGAQFNAMSPLTKNAAAVAAAGVAAAVGATLLFAESAGVLFGGPAAWILGGLTVLGLHFVAQTTNKLCPCLVAPLSRYGRPWIGGLEGYRVCDLASFVVNKFDQMVAEEISPTIEGWRAIAKSTAPFNSPAVANKQWMHVPLTAAVKAQVQGLIKDAATKYGIPANLALGLAQQESGFDPTATSPKGAMGVMQLMPATAAGLGVTSPYDAAQNVDGGMRYLLQLFNDPAFNQNWPTVFAAYNAGPYREKQILAGTSSTPAETKAYVPAVTAAAAQY